MKSFFKSIIVAILTLEARLVLRRYKPHVVAITGSVGKTTTKDVVYAVLSDFFHVRKSEKSFNSELGVPLTILGLQNAWTNPFSWISNILKGFLLIFSTRFALNVARYPSWLVLEVGADRPGDIERIVSWVRPHVSVITAIGDLPVHIEFFRDVEELVHEKGALARGLRPEGELVVNGDDSRTLGIAEGREALLYGFDNLSGVRGSEPEILYSENGKPLGISFKASLSGETHIVKVHGVLGRQNVYPVLAALAVAASQDLNFSQAVKAVRHFVPPPGRMRLLDGVKDTLIIDDSYNASPIAMREALTALRSVRVPGRKIAVLGDMLELGKFSAEAHKKAGELAASVADIIFTVGIRAREIAASALQHGFDEKHVYQYEDSRAAGNELELMLHQGDAVLVKGSQGVRMERIVEEIMAHPDQKEKLLVRQDEEWQRR